MNLLIGSFVLAVLLSMMVAMFCDLHNAIDDADHEELLDQLWSDQPPRAVTLEAAQTTKGMGS